MNVILRIYRRFRYDYSRFKDLTIQNACNAPNVLNTLESLRYINSNYSSCSRFGDGELVLIYGYDLGFQKYNKNLAIRLKEILSSPSSNNNILVCIPDVFKQLSFITLENRFWKHHLYYNRSRWYKRTHKKNIYGDTHISRFYSMRFSRGYSDEIVTELKKTWNSRNIIFIEGEFSRLGIGNDCFDNANSIKRIIAPAKNAFDKYEELLNVALTMPKDSLFILALGPTATVMAYDLAQKGYQALDLGHIDLEYEWYKRGTTEKIPIPGKFCNETFITGAQKKEVIGELPKNELDKYHSQIIYKCI